MRKFMLVCKAEGEQFVLFADTEAEAHDACMDVSCGLGGVCEVYERTMDAEGTALGSIIGLWSEFYELPKGEPKEKEKKGRKKKN